MLSGGRLAKKRNLSAQISQKVFGFTLAELLVILLISSVIMVVLAPVVRKKQTAISDTSSASAQYESVLYTSSSPSADCTTSSDNSLICNFKAPAGVKYINAILVSGGGGGAGATNPYIVSGASAVSNTAGATKTVNIVSGMKNVVITYLSGSGGGGGGGASSQTSGGGAPTSQADCDKYDAKFLTAAQNGGKAVCVTKWNIGDIPDAPNGGIANEVEIARVYFASNGSPQPNSCRTRGLCCWKGRTSSVCDSVGTSYSGCYRTVCYWEAADISCNTLAYNGTNAGDWRLPTKNEVGAWANNISDVNTNKGDNGLRLCSLYEGNKIARCFNSFTSDTQLSWTFNVNYIWTSTLKENAYGNTYHYVYFIYSSGLIMAEKSYATDFTRISTRCVLEKAGPSNISLSGGGGGGAPYFKNYTIPQNIIDSNIGGKIVLYAAAGGAGKKSGNGSDGSDSYIYVYNSSNTLVWGLKTPGGNGGKGATTTSSGAGATAKAANTCQIYQNGAWNNTTCTGAGTAGSNGTKVEGANETTAATGGSGGGSFYNSTSANGGGTGGSASSVNGSNGSRNGAGGGGATVGFDSSGNAKQGTGGNGASGVAQITYDSTYQAASGGGGAGGSYTLLENLPVVAEKTYTVKVGNSGTGGSVNNNGADGGASSISFEGGTYTLGGGGAGKVGTAANESANAIHGIGGLIGTTNISSKLVKLGTAGDAGQQSGTVSIGGLGGKSGINTKGGCGGFSTDTDCTNTASQGNNTAFSAPTTPNTTKQFGSAGAGGGGGGWKSTASSDSGPGGGASGQSGYVYIYWIKYKQD